MKRARANEDQREATWFGRALVADHATLRKIRNRSKMAPDIQTYDVAISFLYQDLALAQALNDKLIEGLDVFFFPGSQEVLAGTDGLESMRKPFRNQSRLNVVLYRPKWGNTPWTAVEEIAVKDSCLATGFKSLFFLVIEPTSELPR